MEERTWKTKDGRILYIKDMSTDHIRNCINMLENKGFVSYRTLSIYLNANTNMMSDGALMAFDYELEQISKRPVSKSLDWLRDEFKQRGYEL